MRIAIIGSGAAAVGVLDRLSMLEPRPQITLIERAERTPPKPSFETWNKERLRSAYKTIKAEHGRSFPPPKTNFGMRPSMTEVEGWGRVWDSNAYGGLTTLWGLCSVPFSAHELQDWPFGRAELDPHYAAISKRIGVSGEEDALGRCFGEGFVNRPPITTTPTIRLLNERMNESSPGTTYRLISGISRLAVDTRPGADSGCVACGECMVGCPQGAMYSSVPDMQSYQRTGSISRAIFGRALVVEGDPHHIVVEAAGGSWEAVGPFDVIYVCAGCLGTTELAMRSLGLRDGPSFTDNSVYDIPLVYTGSATWDSGEDGGHLALANLIINAIPLNSKDYSAQIQIYPLFDHLWRYFVPSSLWSNMQSLTRALRRRLIIARVFVHGDYSQRYSVHLEGRKAPTVALEHIGVPLSNIPGLWHDIRRAFKDAGFLSPINPIRSTTSSHYAASLPLGHGPVASDASIRPGVYLCDSAVFPTAPASSPTFTIMANARRIAHESIRNW